ncbi:MAG TPA: hypothetical protein PK177_05875 [Burkholderiaceae bacterium]|nr:hypothetical protein [Burkholderiaceae bacterium]
MKRVIRPSAIAALALLVIAVSFASPAQAKIQAADTAAAASAPGCTFDTLSAEDRKRYQSRYKRRVRIDGKAYADAWLQENACPTAEQRAARKQAKGKDGRPCKRTRLEMRVSPGFNGPMTMSPVPVCAD